MSRSALLVMVPFVVSWAGCAATPAPSPSPSASPSASPPHDHSGHGPLVHRFENADEWAKRFDDPARDAWQKPQDVVTAMRIAPGMVVADIGAGTGYFEPYLSRAVGPTGTVMALDI